MTEALEWVQKNVKAGNFQMSNQLDSGWGGEAFGTKKAAMTVEGNWIKGAVKNDYPDLKYKTVELPAGPEGKGTLQFTQCWGISTESKAQAQAVDLVKALSTVEQQMAFADAFGVMPSRQSAADEYKSKFPEDAAFIAGGEYGHGPINAPGMEQVVADLNSKLEDFGGGQHPAGARGLRHQRERGARAVTHAHRPRTRSPARAGPRGGVARARGSASRSPGGCSSRPCWLILGLFLVIPIVMALWVSVTDWNGRGSPFSSRVNLVGAENYAALLTEPGLSRQDFMISLRNTFYYVSAWSRCRR